MNRFKMRFPLYLSLFIFIIGLSTCKNEIASDPNIGDINVVPIETVVVRLAASPDALNPLLMNTGYASQVGYHLFKPLMGFDPYSLELIPVLAKGRPEIKTSIDEAQSEITTYTYELLDEAKWDNGTPILAADCVFTFKAIFNPIVNAGGIRGFFDFLVDIEIDPANPRKLTFITNRKYILIEEAISNLPLLPAYRYDPEGLMADVALKDLIDADKAKKLVEENPNIEQFGTTFNLPKYSRGADFIEGAGPYKLVEWDEVTQTIILERKENWWGSSLAKQRPILTAEPKRIVYKIIGDEAAAISVLKNGEIDIMTTMSVSNFTSLKKEKNLQNTYNFHSPLYMIYYYLGLNTKIEKLENKLVRKALAHALDMNEIINTVFFELGTRTIGPFHPSKSYYHNELQPIPYDIEKSKKLLKEAGWEDTNGNGIVDKLIDGERVEMSLALKISTSSSTAKDIGSIYKTNAIKAGIDIVLDFVDFKTLTKNYKSRDYEMVVSAWGKAPTLDDPQQIWHTKNDTPNGSNRVGFGNAASDALIDEIRSTLDPIKRKELYLRFQELIYEEQPYIFMVVPLERIVTHQRLDLKTSVVRPGVFENYIKSNPNYKNK